MIGFFLAGTETTAKSAQIIIYFLTQYPQVYAKVKEEVDQFYGDGINVTIENIQKMDYLMATIKESLRVFSPGIFNL